MNSDKSSKIRVVHYCNQLGIGGTERTMEIFCELLNKDRFEVHALSRVHMPSLGARLKVGLGLLIGNRKAKGKKKLWDSMNVRVPAFQRILGADHVHFAESDFDMQRILRDIKPHVLHVHYSGRPELPISSEDIMSQIPVVVTTNQFELENTAPSHRYVKKMFFVSRWLLENKAPWAKKDPRADIMYNLIEPPFSLEDLRSELGIPNDAFVIGRVGRADSGIHDPISLEAFNRMADGHCYFLALSPPENMVSQAKDFGIKNFIALPPTTDRVRLSRFYNTLDVLAHARRDGETFGCNIAEAMIHGVPVVTHLTNFMNAQQETVGDGGVVCPRSDVHAYESALRKFRDDAVYRQKIADQAKTRAFKEFEASILTKRLEQTYEELLSQKLER